LQNHFFQVLEQYPQLAVMISIFISILIAVIGVLPSFFITAANILFFGFWNGTLISFIGESIGAAIAFLLYRRGFKKTMESKLLKYENLKKLLSAQNKEAFQLIFSLRLIPYVPSGLITFAAAIGNVSFNYFLVASSLGKIPALLLESYSVYGVTHFGWQGKLTLLLIGLLLVYILIKQKNKN
jgi:uncharacterized membrane protein YdjX (TVP38/TMEM64 family)